MPFTAITYYVYDVGVFQLQSAFNSSQTTKCLIVKKLYCARRLRNSKTTKQYEQRCRLLMHAVVRSIKPIVKMKVSPRSAFRWWLNTTRRRWTSTWYLLWNHKINYLSIDKLNVFYGLMTFLGINLYLRMQNGRNGKTREVSMTPAQKRAKQ